MRVLAIQNAKTPHDLSLIKQMHRMRARIFAGRLGWQVNIQAGLEFDEFDLLGPTYILALDDDGELAGSVRLLHAEGPTMLSRVFPQLLAKGALQAHSKMVESSRFCVDTLLEAKTCNGVHDATRSLFAAIIEWGLLNGYTQLVTATDVRLERLLRRCDWPMERIGEPCLINETRSVAGILSISEADFRRQRPDGYKSDFMGKQIEIIRHMQACCC